MTTAMLPAGIWLIHVVKSIAVLPVAFIFSRAIGSGEQPWQAADWLASAVLTGRCEHER